MERRAQEIELRVVRAEGARPVVSGHAAPFESESVDLGGFTERIARGAFADTLKERDVRALWSHDTAQVLGRVSAGTLKLAEDERGLAFELDPPDTTIGRDAVTLIERRDVTGMSFGFTVPGGGDNWAKVGGKWLRTLLKIDLHEISIVAFPAYPASDVALRSISDASDALAALKRAQEEEARQFAAEREARERKLRLAERAAR